ncbi:hypothetical protein AB0F15_39505 [Amycolatopsis sp. NPDC026612]|uniref:hypothetical protein n=1 Tax=Amycolatopsis sp. NPDC026612 TaxID=3155466 RepID=UPI0034064BAB
MVNEVRQLSDDEEHLVYDAIGALEIADGVVPVTDFPALTDPALRAAVATRLKRCGRVLNKVGGGYTSGYDDDVADVLVRDGIGVLAPQDRAVLALVLLRCVAIPRARGASVSENWAGATGERSTSLDELAQNRALGKTHIRKSLRRLRAAGLIRRSPRAGITPGPALHRLTPQRTAALWEDLLILAAPDSAYAHVLRSRRTSGDLPDMSGKDAT